MKKKVIIAVALAVVVIAFAVQLIPSKPEIPDKELVYQQLQLEGKEEDFVLSQFKGCTREELIQKWGDPDGSLFGLFGDVWAITETDAIVVYYNSDANVEQIKLRQSEKNG